MPMLLLGTVLGLPLAHERFSCESGAQHVKSRPTNHPQNLVLGVLIAASLPCTQAGFWALHAC